MGLREFISPTGLLILVALAFDFLNGFHDSANIVATIISSRSMRPSKALAMSAVAEFIAPFLFGVAVATTIGHDIVDPRAITISVIFTALLSAIIWNLITWYFGIPSSSSHALIGGIIGAVAIAYGVKLIQLKGLEKVIAALFISPILGMIVGYVLMKVMLFMVRGATPKVNIFFKRGQALTTLSLALSHGTNDAQKTMGIITMGLVSAGYLDEFRVPVWVIAACAAAISLGIAAGGWRIIRTLGGKFYKIRPIHGFTAQASSAVVILGAALLGGPVSTTHVVSSAIVGVGSAERLSKVRWRVMQEIALAWVLTIPATALMACGLYPLVCRVLYT
ncbi:MAG: inorganic phosphate transporter [Chloroflexi bacterium]|nr:MAG: inorganic phosphate transporter [Chloroflexota bacterium]HDN80479.1 inorganic phosphate transporter [Chloroflexota bacterium]